MPCRGIRGATTVKANTADAILDGTCELLTRIADANGLLVGDIASALFVVTPDLKAACHIAYGS
jgi:chorismate mutase